MLINLPYPVPVNRMYRNFNGRMVLSTEGRRWKTQAAMLATLAGVTLIRDGGVKVTIWLHPKTKKNGEASLVCMDLDGALKCALDSLEGVAYTNDKQIIQIEASYGEAREGGGLTIKVGEA